MGKKKMVESILTKEMIDSGAALIREMDDKGLQPDAAFWFYFPDIQSWKLVIAEIQVGQKGPKDVYKKIQSILKKTSEEIKLTLDDIALAKPNAPTVSLLSLAIKTGPGISGIRFKHNVINGTLIEDAYIYRLIKKNA